VRERRILVVAGEPSGDAQAAKLIRAMQEKDPSLRFSGAAGPAMRAAGVEQEVDISDLSVMGISEVFGGLGRVLRAYRRLRRKLRVDPRPALLILVDFPDFNLPLAGAARRAGVPVLYYVSPQVWAWRRRRIAKICRRVDRMIVVFPFEEEIYRARGLDAHFAGHPLAESVSAERPREQTRDRYGLPQDRPLVALLPGSRAATVAHNLPALLGAARLLGDRASFAIARADAIDRQGLERAVAAAGVRVAIIEDDTYNLVAASDAVAVSSGTATVECALLERPMVVVYGMSRLSYAIARRLVRVPYIAMPNIILGEQVVPELIQDRLTAHSLAAELRRILDDGVHARGVSERLAEVRRRLVVPGAAQRAATLALEMVE
jgi:lipid-A-disaccharide synthase